MTSELSTGQGRVCPVSWCVLSELGGSGGTFTWNLTEVRHTNRKWFSDLLCLKMVDSI